jgi:hypothetical protein
MRALEFIAEVAVGTILTKDLIIVVDDHSLDRARERGVDPYAVDYVIKQQMPKVLSKLNQVELGQKIWVYDWSREVALALRRISSTELKFLLKTVWPGMPAKTPGVEKIIKT